MSKREMKKARKIAYSYVMNGKTINWEEMLRVMVGKDQKFLCSYVCDLPKVKKFFPGLKKEIGLE